MSDVPEKIVPAGFDLETLDPAEQRRERMILAAYLSEVLGGTNANVGLALGMSPETIKRWKRREEWPELVKTAEARWLANTRAKVRGRIMDQLSDPDDDKTVRWAAERLIPEFRDKAPEGAPAAGFILIGAAPAGVLRQPEAEDAEEPDPNEIVVGD